MPDLVNVSGDPLLARILAARCGVALVSVADLGLGEGDAGVLEEEVGEGDDARGSVDKGDGEGDQEEEEARAGLHLGCLSCFGERGGCGPVGRGRRRRRDDG